ncbi:MAG: hypothetical protein AAGC55_13450 [Myxococcota bacterium]
MRASHILGLVAASALAACSGSDETTDPNPTVIQPVAPTQTSMVASGNFEGAMDAVASPDGSEFFFSAYRTDESGEAAIFRVSSAGGSAEAIATGEPLEDPSGLLMSCDGTALYIADLGYASGDADPDSEIERAALYRLDLGSNALTTLGHDGIAEAAGLAFNSDCSTLYASGYTEAGQPALFTLSPAGGAATIVAQGAPLESPSGVYVDKDNIAWVMDHQPSRQLGGALFSITADGTAGVVADGLTISTPAGVSLVAGGEIAVIPSRDEDGNGQLITISTVTGERTEVPAPQIIEPAGIRTATQAQVMAVVDADGGAIHRAE